jgi:hypothetical protein
MPTSISAPSSVPLAESATVAEEYLWWLLEGGRELQELSSRHADELVVATKVAVSGSQRSQTKGGRALHASGSASPYMSGSASAALTAATAPAAAQTVAADSCFRVLRLRTGAIEAELAALQLELGRLTASASSATTSASASSLLTGLTHPSQNKATDKKQRRTPALSTGDL